MDYQLLITDTLIIMSILYCAIPHFAAVLACRDNAGLRDRPLVLVGHHKRVFAVSGEAAAYGVVAGLTTRAAQIRCPEALLLEADIDRYRDEAETFLQLLEHGNPTVEPHGWGAAYVDLGTLARRHAEAVPLCSSIGQVVRRELGDALQPSLGWDSSKFTAQAATRRTRPGHLLTISAAREQTFLKPLPMSLLPLGENALQRLGFLGLRTLGQYAALPSAAVWQQFGQAGRLAQRCARGEDNRPVVPRSQEQRLMADDEFETPLVERERLSAALQRLVSPLLAQLRANLQACGQIRLTVHFADRTTQENERSFLVPTAAEGKVISVLRQLLDGMQWRAGAQALKVTLERIQDAVVEQLSLFPAENERERKLQEVQQYLATRFGANRLRRAMLPQPGAPLPEWRVGWVEDNGQ